MLVLTPDLVFASRGGSGYDGGRRYFSEDIMEAKGT